MQRDLDELAQVSFDLAVVGGGILGAFVALEAASRGYRTALVEKKDFGSGTTSGSGKVIHGGIRYLRALRFDLAREALREQETLSGAYPQLVRSLPFLVPTRRGHLREKLVQRAGACVWRGFRKLLGGGLELPPAHYLDGSEVGKLTGAFEGMFAGGLVYHDLQLRSPERFTFEVVREATRSGAAVSNYAEATSLRASTDRVAGLEVRDRLTGAEFEVDARWVVNASGAWAPGIAKSTEGWFPDVALAKGIHVVVDRTEPAVSFALPYRDERDGDTDNGELGPERRIFVMPWEGRTLVGASYTSFDGTPDDAAPSAREIGDFLDGLEEQWPEFGLTDAGVQYAYSGLYPVFGRSIAPTGRYSASLRPLVFDHGSSGGPEGLITAMSVKLTTSRRLADRIVDTIAEQPASPSGSPLRDGRDGTESDWRVEEAERDGSVARFGDPNELACLAERAARSEMAGTLSDVLFRRSWIGHLGHPGRKRLRRAARAMAEPLGWSPATEDREVSAVEEHYASMGIEPAPKAELGPQRSASQGEGSDR